MLALLVWAARGERQSSDRDFSETNVESLVPSAIQEVLKLAVSISLSGQEPFSDELSKRQKPPSHRKRNLRKMSKTLIGQARLNSSPHENGKTDSTACANTKAAIEHVLEG